MNKSDFKSTVLVSIIFTLVFGATNALVEFALLAAKLAIRIAASGGN